MNDVVKVKDLESVFPYLKIGVSTSSLDMKVESDRLRLCKLMNLNPEYLTNNSQIHSDIVNVITKDNIGVVNDGDALITNLYNVPLLTSVADCVPIAFFDPVKKVIGVAHAGWRGTFELIGAKTVESMKDTYGSDPKDIICVIGPSIGSCCYNVSYDLILKFKERFSLFMPLDAIFDRKDEQYYLDLWNINDYSLRNIGVDKKNIIRMDLCTNCNKDKFHSYRGHEQSPKRIGMIIGMTQH